MISMRLGSLLLVGFLLGQACSACPIQLPRSLHSAANYLSHVVHQLATKRSRISLLRIIAGIPGLDATLSHEIHQYVASNGGCTYRRISAATIATMVGLGNVRIYHSMQPCIRTTLYEPNSTSPLQTPVFRPHSTPPSTSDSLDTVPPFQSLSITKETYPTTSLHVPLTAQHPHPPVSPPPRQNLPIYLEHLSDSPKSGAAPVLCLEEGGTLGLGPEVCAATSGPQYLSRTPRNEGKTAHAAPLTSPPSLQPFQEEHRTMTVQPSPLHRCASSSSLNDLSFLRTEVHSTEVLASPPTVSPIPSVPVTARVDSDSAESVSHLQSPTTMIAHRHPPTRSSSISTGGAICGSDSELSNPSNDSSSSDGSRSSHHSNVSLQFIQYHPESDYGLESDACQTTQSSHSATRIIEYHDLRFTLEKRIAKGISGSVYAAQSGSGKSVAVKVIEKRKDYTLNSSELEKLTGRQQLLQERDILVKAAESRSTHTVEILAAFDDRESVYFVMHLYPETLCDWHRRVGRFSLEQLRHISAELVLCVEACWTVLKIIHRDLKPENIFVSPDGHLKVADFGLARMLDLGDGPGEVVGTHGYIPPETITWGPATRAIDIWSLGIILLELHMGLHKPFFADLDDATMNTLFAQPVIPDTWGVEDDDARELINKMLRREPRRRATIEEIKQDRYFSVSLIPINWENAHPAGCGYSPPTEGGGMGPGPNNAYGSESTLDVTEEHDSWAQQYTWNAEGIPWWVVNEFMNNAEFRARTGRSVFHYVRPFTLL